jgi:hypothetical protein
MKFKISFSVDFDYALSENNILQLTATVQLKHSSPHYYISNFHFRDNPHSHSFLRDIDIMAIKEKDRIKWVHTDFCKESLLSMAVGKAIEAQGEVKISYTMIYNNVSPR